MAGIPEPPAAAQAIEENPEEPPAEPVKPKKVRLTKAQKKELKRQRQNAFRKLEMQTIFDRELELSRKTAKKIKSAWEESLGEMKLYELRQELMVWEQKAQRTLHEKDEKIQYMLRCIGDMEQLNQLIAGKLKVLMEHITDIYKVLLDSSKTLYDNEATNMIVEFNESLNEKRSYDTAWRRHCENIMHTTNLIFEKEMLTDYQIFVERRNDSVNIAIERRYRIRDAIVNKMKSSRQQLLNFVQVLTNTTLDPHKYERIRQLMNRQRAFYIESQRLNELETKQNRFYSDFQRDLLQMEIKFQRKLNDLRLEHSYFIEARKAIEHSIDIDRMVTFEKLRVVSSESYLVLKQFEKLRNYGELLLSIASNVRKLQTESEKVIIWGDFEPSKENKAEMDYLRRFALTTVKPDAIDRPNEELYNEMNLMRIFWRRMAIVETQNAMLNKEKEDLQAENKKYTDFIRNLSKTAEPEKLKDALRVVNILPTQCKCPCMGKMCRRLYKM